LAEQVYNFLLLEKTRIF